MQKNDKSRLSFRAVEVFVAAIEEQSITKAAKRLGSSPSSVSLQLSNMEQILDARLIERSARRFQLTAAGEIFAPRARTILDEVTVAKVELSSAKHAPKMDIRIGAIEDFDNEVLPSLLSKLRRHYPQSNFYINSGASHESHATLSSRGADIIIAADKTSEIDWVEAHAVLHDPFILITASKKLAKAPIDELMRHPFIRYSQEQLIGRQIEAQLRRTKNVPKFDFECSTNHALLSLIKEFDGWAITTAMAYLGSFKQSHPLDDCFIASPLPIPSFARTISVYARRDTLGEIPQAFTTHLKQTLTDIMLDRVAKELDFANGSVRIL
ncbi:MAG: LysR family transcriptional regulator [Lentilitoribacter sp.]